MNKRQKLEVMIMRAKIKAKETMEQHNIAWDAVEAQEIKEGEDAVTGGVTRQVQTSPSP